MTKLAEGKLDLHSKRGAVDLGAGRRVGRCVARRRDRQRQQQPARVRTCGGHRLRSAGARRRRTWAAAARVLAGQPGELETIVVGRDGRLLASSGFRKV
jgi:cobalt-precorrin-5B (C1)-methyltransferase